MAYTPGQVTTGALIYLVSACGSGEEFVAAFRRYADRNGLFVPIADPIPAGRRGRFAVALKDGGVMIEGEAEVVASSRTPTPLHGRAGITLRFVGPDEPSRTVLAELEKARLAMKPPPPSVPPRPTELPAAPRPVPPALGGRIDAANALAESVAIGEPGALEAGPKDAPPPRAGPKFVVPAVLPVARPPAAGSSAVTIHDEDSELTTVAPSRSLQPPGAPGTKPPTEPARLTPPGPPLGPPLERSIELPAQPDADAAAERPIVPPHGPPTELSIAAQPAPEPEEKPSLAASSGSRTDPSAAPPAQRATASLPLPLPLPLAKPAPLPLPLAKPAPLPLPLAKPAPLPIGPPPLPIAPPPPETPRAAGGMPPIATPADAPRAPGSTPPPPAPAEHPARQPGPRAASSSEAVPLPPPPPALAEVAPAGSPPLGGPFAGLELGEPTEFSTAPPAAIATLTTEVDAPVTEAILTTDVD